ncbi:MAG: hypothetical protein INR69_20665, partial [Mucilaginibacter polytrichastri]|nr:hypothetical protein [Mucilaginibacter polytrichastri]
GKKKDAAAIAKAHRNFIRTLFKSHQPAVKLPAKKRTLRHKGVYVGSVVWAFFIGKKHWFKQLQRDFYNQA